MTNGTPVVFLGDFNFHMEDEMNRCTAALRDLLESADLQQHVNQQTHHKGHTLDLIMSSKSDNLIAEVKIHHGLPSDHSAVSCKLPVSRPPTTKNCFRVRDFNNFFNNFNNFLTLITSGLTSYNRHCTHLLNRMWTASSSVWPGFTWAYWQSRAWDNSANKYAS